MKIQPFSQYVIIKLDPADTTVGKDSKLIAPGAMLEAYNIPKRTGTVKAVGRGLVTAGGTIIPPQSQPGDRVYVLETVTPTGQKIENKIEFDGEQCIVLSDESHIIGKILNESNLILEGK
jgi:co-chaperonin GroES (HSP10)